MSCNNCGKELTPEMKECMKAMRIFSLATASKDGVPNVVPVGMLFPGEDGKIWIIDNFFDGTSGKYLSVITCINKLFHSKIFIPVRRRHSTLHLCGNHIADSVFGTESIS